MAIPVEFMAIPVDDSSPHTRRYFPLTREQARALILFSAHAEVFPLET